MIGFALAMLVTFLVIDVALHVWDATGGVDGARARDAERRRRRQLMRAHGPRLRR